MRTVADILVVGLGYIGLPTAAIFADKGLRVVGVDVQADLVAKVNRGEPHFVEPDLDIVLRRVVETGKLTAALTPEAAHVFILAVQTPLTDALEPDCAYLDAAVQAIAPWLNKDNLVIVESTVPVGTTERVSALLGDLRPDLSFPHQAGERSDIRLAHCPERVLPGRILEEVARNDRIIGGITRRCAQRASEVYRLVVTGECHATSARTAETAKLAENAFRDVNIAFANELSVICDRLGVDPWEAIRLANLHPRVRILKPGPGVGGHCISVDPWFLVAAAPQDAELIRTARQRNDAMPAYVAEKVALRAKELESPVIACLGLTYKADVDDLRESPAVEVVAELCRGAVGQVLIVEPHIAEVPAALAGLGLTMSDFDEAVAAADIVVLLVDHRTFAAPDREALRNKIVFDLRGIW